ncbi:hypothetical protein CLOM_g24345 [Closterium sp. NIES-68]|nr:hypothetical protein CLOM_g24345 [Closterium sp. NIES-68]GJP74565.1 hypothetical protein CLOP_g5124 [Closterium sp. NIES-67]
MAVPTLNTPFQPYVYQSPQAVLTPFQILGGEAQIVQIILKPGERVRAEPGAMCYMSGNMSAETAMEEGSVWRWLSGESFFTNTFVNQGPGEGYIGLATPTMAKILPVDLAVHGGEIICQRDAYLCSLNDVTVTAELTRRARVGLFAMDGLFYQKLKGRGLAFISGGGSIVQKNLAAGEVVVVDAGSVLALTRSVDLDVRYVGSIKKALFGGEGICHAYLTGPGVVFLQSLPFHRLARRVERAIASPRLREAPALWLRLMLSVLLLSMLLTALTFAQSQLNMLEFRLNLP